MNIRCKIAPHGKHETQPGVFEVWTPNNIKALVHKEHPRLGYPVYIGFPDHPQFWHRDKDLRPVGRAKLLATEFGLEADMRLNKRGIAACRFKKLHAADHGVFIRTGKCFEIVRLRSIGLTEQPALPIPAVKIP